DIGPVAGQDCLGEIVLDAALELRIKQDPVPGGVFDDVVEEKAVGRLGNAAGRRRDRPHPESVGDYVAGVAEDGVLVGDAPDAAAGRVVIYPHAVTWRAGNPLSGGGVAVDLVEGIRLLDENAVSQIVHAHIANGEAVGGG